MGHRPPTRRGTYAWYSRAALQRRALGPAIALATSLVTACSPPTVSRSLRGAPPTPREVLLTFEAPREVVGVRPGGGDGRLNGVARLHGRVRQATEDSLVLRVVHAWDAEGRPLGLPLSFQVRLARAEAGELKPVPHSATSRERRVALWLATVVGGYVLLLALTMPRT